MKTLRYLLVAALSVLGLSGCLQDEKVVKVKTDGSGTIEETVTMSKETIAMMDGMGNMGGPDAKKDAKKPYEADEEKLKAAAEKMGAGVTFVSAKKVENEKGKGFTAVYAFKDINTLKLGQNPSEVMGDGPGAKPEVSKEDPVTFKFTKGAPAELKIYMPAPKGKDVKKPAQPEGQEEMAMQMMKQVFKDMRMTMAVEVAGTIKETNAEYKDGSRVTLVDMDFNKLLADPEKFKKMAKENPQSLEESKALLKGVEGIKMETTPEVKIKFQ